MRTRTRLSVLLSVCLPLVLLHQGPAAAGSTTPRHDVVPGQTVAAAETEATVATVRLSRSVARSGAQLTAHARVTSAGGEGLNGVVHLCFRLANSARDADFECLSNTFPLTSGTANITFSVRRGSHVAIYFPGNGTNGEKMSAPALLRIAPVLGLTGKKRMMTGSLSPADGQAMQLQKSVKGRWKTIARYKVPASSWKITNVAPGTYRVVVSPVANLLGVTSKATRVR